MIKTIIVLILITLFSFSIGFISGKYDAEKRFYNLVAKVNRSIKQAIKTIKK